MQLVLEQQIKNLLNSKIFVYQATNTAQNSI